MSDDHKSHSGHGDGHGAHGFAHVLPLKLLIGVWAALMILTILTVTVTSIDLGRSVNLSIAMAIATVKAGLVGLYFMHLRWDRPFNAMVFTASLLFVALFISITLLDKSEYEPDIVDYELMQSK
jgi:cytochrome c oxidase subunit 4